MSRSINLHPPKAFDGSPSNWITWGKRFDRYYKGTNLAERSREEQISIFLYTMGECAEDILTTLKIDENDAEVTYETLITAFDDFFDQRKNVIVERAKFNKRVQKEGESIDTFIQDLHKLADECNYGTLKEELIRDRIVVGVIDDDLSLELQSKAKLTLTEAIQLSRQAEARKESQSIIRDKKEAVDYVKRGHYNPHKRHESRPAEKCKRCGKGAHSQRNCPAYDAFCSNCHKKGHFQAMCYSAKTSKSMSKQHGKRKEIHELSDTEDSDNNYMGEIFHVDDDCWSAEINVNGKPNTFKLDTGASVSVLSEKWAKTHKLEKTNKVLKGPGDTKLKVLGSMTAQLKYKEKTITEILYVLKGQKYSLLSRSACVKLGIISRIDKVAVAKAEKVDFKEEFPKLFKGLGNLKTTYNITVKTDANPVCIHAPRKIPHPLQSKVKDEIDRLLKQGVISPVTQPTNWCSGIVVVPKPNGSIRLCVDLVELNKAVKREIHPMVSVDESLAKLANSKVFSKLDAKSGFWQIPLSEESKEYTTFITPFGRYWFNRLPFGISSASEIFQRTISNILGDLEGVICHMDDILIHAPDTETHDKIARAVLQKLEAAGLTLNEKCEFAKSSVRFLGHIIDGTGIHVDTTKVEAINAFTVPKNITELQRFMGMVNQLAKFLPNLAEITAPLRSLLKKDTVWIWDTQQQQAFQQVKQLLISPPVLAHYSQKRKTIIAADASNYGIGAVMYQEQDDGNRKPVCFISRSLTDAEKNYAAIEKEALAVTWACERLSEYILGLEITIETDHKPLIPLLNNKELYKMPPRILRFKLRLMKYSIKVIHVAGKQQIIADALSRAPSTKLTDSDIQLIDDTTVFTQQCIENLSSATKQLQEIKEAQIRDPEIAEIRNYINNRWPTYIPENQNLKQYWVNKEHLTIVDNMLLFDDRIVIPHELRQNVLNLLHEGHQGITKTKALASFSVWWPYISSQIEDMVRKCNTCAIHRPERKEPLLPSSFPDRPWSKVGMDLFELKGKTYITIVDYYSRWIELRLLERQTCAHTISKIKSIFSVHGIPDVVISDNGPQFSSADFKAFANEYGFTHTTSSPRYPQSNGEAERAVQTVKQMLKKAKDPYAAILQYRATPLQNGYSPSELLMGRNLKTKLPILPVKLLTKAPDHAAVQEKEKDRKEKNRHYYNKRHAVKDAQTLKTNEQVYIKDLQKMGKITAQHHNPRSYIISTGQGNVRRNRTHLVPIQDKVVTADHSNPQQNTDATTQSTPVQKTMDKTVQPGHNATTYTRSGRAIQMPDRLNL